MIEGLDFLFVGNDVDFLRVKIHHDLDLLEQIQPLKLLDDIRDKPEGVQLDDRQVRFASAQEMEIFYGAFGRHYFKLDAFLRHQILDVLSDPKIAAVARSGGNRERECRLSIEINDYRQQDFFHDFLLLIVSPDTGKSPRD